MSSRIDRVGTFRAQAVDWALAKPEWVPQLAVVCKLVEFYDEQDGEWVDWSQYDMQETAYFCLFGTNKKTKELEPTLSCEQVMGVFDWSGESFADLAVYDPGDLVFQVRSGVNTYEAAKHPFQIEWLVEADADPTRSLKKLDAEGVKALDNEFASLLSGIKKPKAAASAKKPKPKAASAKKPKAAASAPAQGDKKLAPPPPPPSDHPNQPYLTLTQWVHVPNRKPGKPVVNWPTQIVRMTSGLMRGRLQ